MGRISSRTMPCSMLSPRPRWPRLWRRRCCAGGASSSSRSSAPGPDRRACGAPLSRAGERPRLRSERGRMGDLDPEPLRGAGAERVTAVEAAPAYVAAAREEAGRRNVADRLDLVNGDFVSVAGDVMPADVVTMDRVVCCYPAYQPLLEAALRRSRRLLAFSYPRDRWYVRAAVGMQNLSRALFRSPFRGFVHSAREAPKGTSKQGAAQILSRALFRSPFRGFMHSAREAPKETPKQGASQNLSRAL